MAINQLSVFVENKQGTLNEITKILADGGVDMTALTLADTPDFGIMRMIVTDTDKAVALLSGDGHLVKVSPVVAVEIPNEPGALAKVVSVLAESGINVEYLYAFIAVCGKNARVVLRVTDNDAAEKLLAEKGVVCL